MVDRISNAEARRLFLWLHELSGTPAGPLRRGGLPAVVERLGFVQIDSIRTVERAHHHILATRGRGYRPGWLDHHVEVERTLFENWTHDASIIPVQFFPFWKARFRRARSAIMNSQWWRSRIGDDPEATCRKVLEHIAENGPAMARDLKSGNPAPPAGATGPQSGWWGWHPSKAAMVFLWRTGALSVSGRRGFQKIYDLTERVIPEAYRLEEPSPAVFVDWACSSALERLGIASHGEIARFWDAVRPDEVADWIAGAGREALIPVEVTAADGSARPAWARPDLREVMQRLPDPPARIRFLSPFDPVLRDRSRTERLFGFDFRIEIFVPRARRVYGYYVYPMLEQADFIGRIEMKADRVAESLDVLGLWLEPGIAMTRSRQARVEAELDRWRRYAGLSRVVWRTGQAAYSASGH